MNVIIYLTAGGSIFSPEEPVDSPPRNDDRPDLNQVIISCILLSCVSFKMLKKVFCNLFSPFYVCLANRKCLCNLICGIFVAGH